MLRKILAFGLTAALCMGLAACKEKAPIPTAAVPTGEVVLDVDVGTLFSDRDRDDSYQNPVKIILSDSGSSAGGGVAVEGSTVTISKEGTYLVSGTLSDGQLRVAVGEKDKVQVVLDNVNIQNASDAALYVSQGDKVFVTLAEGSENTLCATGAFAGDDGVDAAVFSRADLTFNGTGKLTVTADSGHGIVSKDDLKITGGEYAVTASGQGLTGKDSLCIESGSFAINSGTDGLHAKNEEDATLGNIYLLGGTFAITSGSDGMDASRDLGIMGGSITIASDDDGLHAENALGISGGTIRITKSIEGLEANYITISGGDIALSASDDGINAAGGNDGSGMEEPFGHGGGFGQATDAYVLICGGRLAVNAGGDGIDSNGALTVTGGEVYVDGPTNGGNGPLDYAGEATITGGTFIALGSAGMAMNFGTNSTQGAILCGLNGSAQAGTLVSVKDGSGKVLASYTSQKTFQSVLISAPGMKKGQTYTVCVGDASGEFTLDSIIYGSGMGGMGGGPGGRPGGRGA